MSLKSMLTVGSSAKTMPLTTAGFLIEDGKWWNFLRIIHVDPEVSESIGATYQKHIIPGRNLPVFAFSGMEGRSISITLHFIATYSPVIEVQRKIDWLKTLYYPRDLADRTVPPSKVLLSIGAHILVKGVMTKFNATHKPPFGGLNTEGGMILMLPHYATVDITVEETENFFTGKLPDRDTAETQAALGMDLLGAPSWMISLVRSPLNFL